MSEIQLHEIDFETVRQCHDVRKLKTIIQLLKDEPYYPELLQSALDRLGDLSPDAALEMTPASSLDAPCSSDIASFQQWISQQTRIEQATCNRKMEATPGHPIVDGLHSADERRALHQKTIGNDYFRSQDYSTAIKYYTKAAEIAPSNSETQSVCYFNRANCSFHLKLWKKCEKDCTLALDINPKYVKAFFLRAKARESLNKLYDANDDLEACFMLEPENDQISVYLENMRSKLPVRVIDESEEGTSFTRLEIVEVEENDDGFDDQHYAMASLEDPE